MGKILPLFFDENMQQSMNISLKRALSSDISRLSSIICTYRLICIVIQSGQKFLEPMRFFGGNILSNYMAVASSVR